jgi:lipoprotein-anchoring transpeptidase ErfK/SrfK
MIIRGKLGQAALGLGAVVAAAVSLTVPASAQQLFFDWGGGNTSVGGSGRETVSFSPKYAKGQVIVSFGDRRLYYVTQPGQALSYPIAIPREQSRWAGVTAVSQKRENPTWTPTPTMIAENPRLPRWVPGGHPMNPLGNRALYLGSSMYRIHGTDAPWTIGSAVSKGCIRLYNQDVADLYPRVSIGTKVTVTWDRFTTTASANSAPPPAATQSGNGGGNLFDLFGDDDEPVQKAPPRRTKSKAADKSALVQ